MIATYEVVSVPYVVDGDTLWVVRRRPIGEVEGGMVLYQDNIGGTSIRLHDGDDGLDTPERAESVRWAAARADLTAWVRAQLPIGITLHVYGRDKYGRLLGNLHSVGTSAVAHMLTLGWPAYRVS